MDHSRRSCNCSAGPAASRSRAGRAPWPWTALAVLARYEADVVTIDQNLPDTDGATLAREIRARVRWPIRLLCISGATPDDGYGLDVFDQVLVKPVDPKRLLSLLGHHRTDATGTNVA